MNPSSLRGCGEALNTPSAQWQQFKDTILREIELIDSKTPWGEVEPGWWLEMMRVHRMLRP